MLQQLKNYLFMLVYLVCLYDSLVAVQVLDDLCTCVFYLVCGVVFVHQVYEGTHQLEHFRLIRIHPLKHLTHQRAQ